jgi:ubiquinone/menaquinone biosynthesis C-methylase UbiE
MIASGELSLDTAQRGVRDYWDYGSRFYEETPGLCTEEEAGIWQAELEKVIGPAPRKILDVGTGTGYVAMILAKMGHHVTGVDFSLQMLDRARHNITGAGVRATLLEGDAENLAFPEATFDCVTARYLVWTLPRPETTMREWRRVLKPGGRLVVIDGYWKPIGVLQKACRFNFQIYRWLKCSKKLFTDKYNGDLGRRLPHPDGIRKAEIAAYMTGADLTGITTQDLDRIRAVQKKHAPWYLKYAYDYPTYLLSGAAADRESEVMS